MLWLFAIAYPSQGAGNCSDCPWSWASQQGSRSMPCLSARVGGECTNEFCQFLHLWREAQISSALLADAPSLANESPSHIVQVLFKLVLLCWILWQVSLHVSPLKGDSQFPTALWVLWTSAPFVSWAHLCGADPKGWGACCRAPAPHFSEKSTALVRCLPTGCQCARDRVFCQDVSLPVLFISVWSFCPLLWRNSSSCFQVFFREKWPICSCDLQRLWEEVSSGSSYATILDSSIKTILEARNIGKILQFILCGY